MNSITTTTLDCGLPLIVEESRAVRSAAVCWLLPVGSAADPADREGLSTLLSELMFRGAGDLSSRGQADALDRLGLARGSEVGGHYMRLTATMVGDRILPALALLAEIVRRIRIDEEHIEPARDLALQALAGLKDDPQSRAGVLLGLRHNHLPFHRSGMGTEAGLRAVTADDLRNGWAARVRPRGSILAIAGAVDAAACARELNTLLRGWEGAAPEVARDENPLKGSYIHEADTTNQVQIYLAHDGPAEASPLSTPERVVSSVLSGGTSARLFTEVRERRALCYSVHAGYTSEKHHGRITGYVGTTPEKAQQSLDVMLQELRRINTPAGAVTSEELHRAIVGYRSRLVFSGESTGARAGALATDFHRLGRARSLEEVSGLVERVTLAGINEYLSRRAIGPITVVTLGPTALKVN
ncbi:MAG: M16 family metallopeptidase [Phycisphaerales bacterium]